MHVGVTGAAGAAGFDFFFAAPAVCVDIRSSTTAKDTMTVSRIDAIFLMKEETGFIINPTTWRRMKGKIIHRKLLEMIVHEHDVKSYEVIVLVLLYMSNA